MVKTEEQLRQEFIARCNETSKAKIAKQLDVSRTYVGDIVYGKRGISAEVAKFLGYKLQVNTTREYVAVK